jgi:hypothetical protein
MSKVTLHKINSCHCPAFQHPSIPAPMKPCCAGTLRVVSWGKHSSIPIFLNHLPPSPLTDCPLPLLPPVLPVPPVVQKEYNHPLAPLPRAHGAHRENIPPPSSPRAPRAPRGSKKFNHPLAPLPRAHRAHRENIPPPSSPRAPRAPRGSIFPLPSSLLPLTPYLLPLPPAPPDTKTTRNDPRSYRPCFSR